MHGRDEDDCRRFEARVLANQRRKLETVEIGHADVDQDDGDVDLQQLLKRLPAGVHLDQVLAQILEDHFIAEDFGRLVVYQQDVDFFVFRHPALPMEPHPQG